MTSQGKRQGSKAEEASVSNSGVDLTLIRKYLAMTPTERLRAWENATRLALELKSMLPDLQTVLEILVRRTYGRNSIVA